MSEIVRNFRIFRPKNLCPKIKCPKFIGPKFLEVKVDLRACNFDILPLPLLLPSIFKLKYLANFLPKICQNFNFFQKKGKRGHCTIIHSRVSIIHYYSHTSFIIHLITYLQQRSTQSQPSSKIQAL